MTDLIVVPQTNQWQRLKALVLDSVSSPITRRVYNLGLDEFFAWYGQEPRAGFTKATVSAWRVCLEARGLGAVSINVRITAVRKLAVEAADNGLLAPELANGITRVKGVASKGIRLGNWLSVKQAQTLLNTPDVSTVKGLRDRAILAVLLGCGLRRSEVATLTVGHVQQRDGRWCIVDLVGKHGRVRTIPMPTWVKVAQDAWTAAAGVADGYVFRPVNRGGQAHDVGRAKRWFGNCSKATPRRLAFRESHLMTFVAHARRCVGLRAVNWSRSNCCSGTHQCKLPSGTWARSRIWSMRQTMGSS
jgi:integrase